MTTPHCDLSVHSLSNNDTAAWDAFVEGHTEATFFHRAGWRRVIESSFGHRPYFTYVKQGDEIRGVLPLVHVKSRLFGNRLVSSPFCVRGGPLTLDDEARRKLDDYCLDLADNLNVDFIEYRSDKVTKPDWVCNDDLYFLFRKEIDTSTEANLKAIPRKQRAVVRKTLKADELRDEVDHDPDRFYDIYAVSVRNLGSPVFSKRYCQNLKQEFGDDCEFLIVTGPDGATVTGVLQFYFRDEVLPYYGGGSLQARRYGAHDFMYWRSICRAAERNVRIFDFGRSKVGTGTFSFKKNWGFQPQALSYEYKLIRGNSLPNANALNPKYQLMINMWKRLPLPIANTIGPHLVSALG
jgi:FemAB-related protein (PEP-CTERM system-associated)